MRKPTREERKILIEKGKTISIVILFVCCVLLLCLVFNLFKGQFSIGKIFAENKKTTVSGESGEPLTKNTVRTFWELSEPETIMVFSGEKRVVISRVNVDYQKITENVGTIMKSLYSADSEKLLESDSEQWKAALKGNGIYVKFFGKRNIAFEEQFYGAKDTGLKKKISAYSEVLIVPEDNNKDVTVFLKEAAKEAYVKFAFSAEAEALKKGIKACEDAEKDKYLFGFELNEAKKQSETQLDPNLLVSNEKKNVDNVIVSLPDIYKENFDLTKPTAFTTGMISLFGYNPNTVRQYANDEGSLIFVGETGNLTISPEGKIEYKALGENEGISFVNSAQSTSMAYSVISGVSQFSEKIFSLCGVSDKTTKAALRITQFPFEEEKQLITVEMRYFADGIEVSFNNEPALTAVIKDGVMTELRMWVKNVQKPGETTECDNSVAVVERYSLANPSIKNITSARLVYLYKEDEKELSATWRIQGEK